MPYSFNLMAEMTDEQLCQALVLCSTPTSSATPWLSSHQWPMPSTSWACTVIRTTKTRRRTALASAPKTKKRHDFVEFSLLTWKYRVNVDPDLEDKYKHTAFNLWRKLSTDDPASAGFFADDHSVGDVPVPGTTDETQKLVKSLFWLTQTYYGL